MGLGMRAARKDMIRAQNEITAVLLLKLLLGTFASNRYKKDIPLHAKEPGQASHAVQAEGI